MTQHGGWRASFLAAGVPGVLAALCLLLFVEEPVRGAADPLRASWERENLRGLFHNAPYLSVVAGMSSLVFGMVGIAVWLPTFYVRFGGYPVSSAAKLVGVITLVSGVAGTCAGAALSQRWSRRNALAPYLVSAWSLAVCVVLGFGAIFGPSMLLTPCVLIAEFFLFFNAAPLNVALVNSVSARIRATAVAICLFAVHAFGDAISPELIGHLSDRYSLRIALSASLLSIAVGAAVLFMGVQIVARGAGQNESVEIGS